MKEVFLKLVRIGIEHYEDSIPQIINWQEVKDLAAKQGLSAVVLDGIDNLPDYRRPSKDFLLEWIAETLQGYEYRYDLYLKAIAELAGFYNRHGFKMMVLKGYACSLDWLKPNHRPCGDIDIWLFGKQREADSLLVKEKNVEIDSSHHHHTVFIWRDFSVENHYDFISVYHHMSHARLEKLFKELGDEYNIKESNNNNSGGMGIQSVNVCGEKVYLPSPDLHALFLLKHTMLHFVSGEINLRQIVDWGFFVEKHGNDVDWKWLLDVLEEYGMTPAFNIFNAICVEDLGFDASFFPQIQFSPIVKERALNEILYAESTNNGPKGFFSHLKYRYRRWKASSWKHDLCYKESMTSAFWYGVWGHIIKPKSFWTHN